ncbi:SIR2 family protein [Chitinimonas taiwanensis]|uniref:SIR2 family protein n=1 Tax=Chitinimonas taiwanensis TaxID=240412 RepID=UPI0035B31650
MKKPFGSRGGMITFNPDLVEDLANRKAVIFLGAGVSTAAKTSKGNEFKSWEEILSLGSDFIEDVDLKLVTKELISRKDFLVACEIIKVELGEKWIDIITSEFSKTAKPSDLHNAIFALDQRIIITTNFDKLIENFHSSLSADKDEYPIVVPRVDAKIFKMLRDNRDYIIKLHGSIDEADKVTFDKGSYNDNAYGNPFYSELLKTLLLTHTFVFIGFSMDDPAINSVVELYAHQFSDVRPHCIFIGKKLPRRVKEVWKTYKKLYILEYDPKNNHKALASNLKKLAEEVKKKRNLLKP